MIYYTIGLHLSCIQVDHTTITGRLPPPSKLYISIANFVSRHFTFSWSPVAPDCPAIHYNILASNCGSCPATTNHTNVTCTGAPTENSLCRFAIQTVACRNLVGYISDPISIHTSTSQDRNNAGTCTNTVYVIATSSLAVVLITSIVVFATTTVIILQRSKAKIKKLQLSNSSSHMESVYEDPSQSVSAIDTQDNVAYGHTKTLTAAM